MAEQVQRVLDPASAKQGRGVQDRAQLPGPEAPRPLRHGDGPLQQGLVQVVRDEAQTKRASVADKNELLFQHGINFNTLPTWQRRGTGLYWEDYRKAGFNPQQQRTVRTTRRRLKIDLALPMKDGYGQLLRSIMHRSRVSVRHRNPA
jgi:hypothetical protein